MQYEASKNILSYFYLLQMTRITNTVIEHKYMNGKFFLQCCDEFESFVLPEFVALTFVYLVLLFKYRRSGFKSFADSADSTNFRN